MTQARSVPAQGAPVLTGVELRGEPVPGTEELLSPAALAFVAGLERRFRAERERLLARRAEVQERLDAGWRPDFLEETRAVREAAWHIAPVPDALLDRRVEITGPVDRKTVVNALGSGADVFMADFEDAHSPTWRGTLEGQRNLYDAVRRQVDFVHPETGKAYRLPERTAKLFVRPRGWHLEEKHVLVDGRRVSASLFDAGLFLFHNARELVARGAGPWLYLPKLEGHREARLWNEVFLAAQDELGLPLGTVKATVLVETLLAAFEMHEILYELREHSAGLNCGRWDYIFSFVKKLRADPACVLPDRARVGMEQPFLRAYSQLLIRTCHRRGAHAMGGMAAQVPIRDDPEANAAALEKVRADKRREAREGHDGTWVAHPGLIAIAREELEAAFDGPNQLGRLREDVEVTAADLLEVPRGPITEAGLRQNLAVGVRYLEAWLSGDGCVAIEHLMEDAATAEISRAQVWQWVHHEADLDDGRPVDLDLFRRVLTEELDGLRRAVGDERYTSGRFDLAAQLFEQLVASPEPPEFLTLLAYEHL